MTTFGKFPKKIEAHPVTNKYDLKPIIIADKQTVARPYQFDDDIATDFTTTCPHCGHGILFNIDQTTNLGVSCPNCHKGEIPKVEPQIDPFQNPVAAGKINLVDLDPDLTDVGKYEDQAVAEINVHDKLKSLGLDDDLKPKKKPKSTRADNEDNPG